jgi:hypothetical protein
MKPRFALFILILLCAVPCVWAQTDAAISGTVYDTTGAVLPGVAVKLTSKAQGTVRNVQTNESGIYQFSFLPPGGYVLEVSLPGFKTLTRSDIQLAVAQNLRRDLNLEIGNVAENVMVTTAEESVNTESADLGAVIDNRKVVEMPLNGRVFFSLPTLTPGVVPPAQGSGLGYRGGFNVAGSCEGCNNFILNGMDNNDNNKQIPNFRPSIDAIGEFNILTGIYPAQYGYGSGGQIIVTTKSGTNEFHGSAYDFLRNQAIWTARNYFQSGVPSFRRNQFGGTFGGPIQNDKTFFFFSYEGLRLATTVSQATSVPTTAMQNGDFSSLLPGKVIRDPLTGSPFSGNIIPSVRFNEVGLALMRFYPAPTSPTAPGAQPINNYSFNQTRTELYNTFSLKLDHTFSQTDSGFLTANYYNDHSIEPQVNSCSSSYLPGFGCDLRQKSQVYGISETHIFSPTKVNESRISFNETLQPAINIIASVPFWSKFGIQSYVETGSQLPKDGTPGVSVAGYQSFPAPAPFRRADPHWQFTDTFSWTLNRHTVKIGANLSHFSTNDVQANPTGSLTFTSTSAGPTTGYSMADLLLGLPQSTSNAPYAYKAYLRAANFATFVQDDYKVGPRLTLNLGLRWEVNTPPIDRGRHLTNFDPVKGIPITQANPAPNAPGGPITVGFPGERVFNFDYRDFAPRFGFAWQPFGTGKTVVRGGAGTFFQNFGLWNGTGNIRFGAPYTINNTYTSSIAQPISLSNPFPASNAVTSNSLSGLDPNYKNQRVYEWSLGFQRQLTQSLMAEITYFGSVGNHLQMTHNLNQPAPGAGTPAQVNARRPYPAYGTVNYSEWGGVSHYHSLAAKLQKQYSHGLSFLASYTFAKSIDDLNGLTDQHDFRTGRGPSSFDTPQRFVISPVYELPFGPGKALATRGVAGAIAGGWQFSPLFQWQTGNPLTAVLSGNYSNSGGSRDRPDLIGDPNANAPHTAQKWFDTSVFVLRPANNTPGATYSFGNEGVGVIRAPGLVQLDLSIVRNFQIREKMRAQFRVELFNALNHTNFGYPNVTADNAQFGTISSALDPRQSQFALKISF